MVNYNPYTAPAESVSPTVSMHKRLSLPPSLYIEYASTLGVTSLAITSYTFDGSIDSTEFVTTILALGYIALTRRDVKQCLRTYTSTNEST
jgi:hypothetical protein